MLQFVVTLHARNPIFVVDEYHDRLKAFLLDLRSVDPRFSQHNDLIAGLKEPRGRAIEANNAAALFPAITYVRQ